MYLIGYELSDSAVSVALLDAETYQVKAELFYPENRMDVISRRSGWAEQQPEVWWHNFCQATHKILQTTAVDPSDIKGIGLSYQMHGLVMVNREQQVLRPSIIWSDGRASSIGEKAYKEIGSNFCMQNLLNSPGNFTASKLKWVKDNEPDVYGRIDKFMLPGDYLALKLTGKPTTTISGLSECILWNYLNKNVASELLEYYGISNNLVCDVVPGFGFQGEVTTLASEMTGLKAGTPVTYRAGDQPTNALSVNVLNPGEITASGGSSGVVYGIVDEPVYDVHSRVNAFTHVNYESNFDRIGILLCINGGGIQYNWMKQQVARPENSLLDMDRMAQSVQVGSDGLGILPFGNGAERIFENKNVKAHFLNLQFHRHTRSHLFRAALEGLAFSFFYGFNYLKELGLDVNVIRVEKDNIFQSEVFSTTLATLLGCQIEVVETSGALGAARGAGLGSGIFTTLENAVEGIKPSITFEPELNQTDCLQAYNLWKSGLDAILNHQGPHDLVEQSYKSRYVQLDKELNKRSADLARTSMQLESKNTFLNSIKNDLEKLKDGLSGHDSQIRKIVSRIEEHVGDNKEWQVVEEHFNLLHDDFFIKLKEKYPRLSPQDAKLCALIKLKMSTKEIATRLNLSVRGVETKRYRLRKKLMNDDGNDLVQFLDSL